MFGGEVAVGGARQLRRDRSQRGDRGGGGRPLRGGHRVVARPPRGEHGIAARHPAGVTQPVCGEQALGVGPEPRESGRGGAQIVDPHGESRHPEHAASVLAGPVRRGRTAPPHSIGRARTRPSGEARPHANHAYAAEMTRATRLTLDADGQLRHRIPPGELSNDLAGWIADDLVAPGLIPPNAFERTFVSVVGDAWLPFYRNTLRELACGGAPGGTNAGMAPVHDRAADLAHGSVVGAGVLLRVPLPPPGPRRPPGDGRRPVARHGRAPRLGRAGAGHATARGRRGRDRDTAGRPQRRHRVRRAPPRAPAARARVTR